MLNPIGIPSTITSIEMNQHLREMKVVDSKGSLGQVSTKSGMTSWVMLSIYFAA